MYIPLWLIAVVLVVVVAYILRRKIVRWFQLKYFCYQIEAASKRGDAGAIARWGMKAEAIGWNWEAQKWND
jgi:hypothetical protein